jgi:hypothetical protein
VLTAAAAAPAAALDLQLQLNLALPAHRAFVKVLTAWWEEQAADEQVVAEAEARTSPCKADSQAPTSSSFSSSDSSALCAAATLGTPIDTWAHIACSAVTYADAGAAASPEQLAGDPTQLVVAAFEQGSSAIRMQQSRTSPLNAQHSGEEHLPVTVSSNGASSDDHCAEYESQEYNSTKSANMSHRPERATSGSGKAPPASTAAMPLSGRYQLGMTIRVVPLLLVNRNRTLRTGFGFTLGVYFRLVGPTWITTTSGAA